MTRQLIERLFVVSVLLLAATLPIEDVAAVGPISLSRLVAAASFGLFALLVLTGHVVPSRPELPALWMLALLAWITLSYFWSEAPGATFVYITTFLQLAVLVVMVWCVCTTALRCRMLYAALSVGGTIGAVVTLLSTTPAHGGTPRFGVGDPNDFGVSLAVTMVATLGLIRGARPRWLGVVLALAAALQVAAVLRTASRTAAVAVVVAALVMLVDRRLLQRRVIAGLAVVVAVTGFVLVRFGNAAAFGRIGTILSDVESGDLNHRGEKWRLAFSLWDGSPIQGIGGSAFRAESESTGRGTAVHSVWVGALTELGLVGLVLLAGVVVIAVWRVLASGDLTLGQPLVAMLAAWVVGSLTLSVENNKLPWLLIAMATSAAFARRARPASSAVDPDPVLEVSSPTPSATGASVRRGSVPAS